MKILGKSKKKIYKIKTSNKIKNKTNLMKEIKKY